MQLADEHIKEFQVLYKKHYGVEISTAEALAKGIRLIRLMEIVLKHEAKKQATQVLPAPTN
jgi:hypothetical protein